MAPIRHSYKCVRRASNSHKEAARESSKHSGERTRVEAKHDCSPPSRAQSAVSGRKVNSESIRVPMTHRRSCYELKGCGTCPLRGKEIRFSRDSDDLFTE
ncbi:hypothetical protein CDAR_94871 [Caerostris darwini]|uniref:Uncharacterized protein n=1 Tax=Caerostris darwini TaxID=1538125 RepID=A0AAV4PM27_9ARAC|nr:hypothetical protein CDAR_94871 [Caerostris darwini]